MALSDNLRGALYMNLSMFAFTVNDSFMKAVTHDLPLYQTITLRGGIAVALLLILAAATGGLASPQAPRDRWVILMRSLADVVATILFLSALMHMPLANLSAVMQAIPLAVTLGAALVYKDKIGWRRMAATRDVANSGMLVPAATMVSPITASLTPKVLARSTE